MAGCSATGDSSTERPLPFHAVFAPLSVEERVLGVGEAAGGSDGRGAEGDITLDLDAGLLSAALESELDGRAFARVSFVSAGDASAVAAGRRELEAAWLARAASLRGDILVRATLEFDPRVEEHINDRFWLNLPLFLLGGPFCYFIEDRTYAGRARLLVEFFDLSSEPTSLEDEHEILRVPIVADFGEVTLAFVDRAGRSLSSYALSLLLPAGLLATRTESVDSKLDSGAIDALVADLLLKVREQRGSFQSTGRSAFYLDEASVRVERGPDGRVDLAIPLVVPVPRRLRDYVLAWDGGGEEGDFPQDEVETIPEGRRLWLRRALDVRAGEHYVHLSIGDDQAGRRAYTFRIAEPEPVPQVVPTAPSTGTRTP